jgi:hypothetical protein
MSIPELEAELALYRAGWQEQTVLSAAEEIRRLRGIGSMEFERGFDTTEETAAYQLGVLDVQREIRGETA